MANTHKKEKYWVVTLGFGFKSHDFGWRPTRRLGKTGNLNRPEQAGRKLKCASSGI